MLHILEYALSEGSLDNVGIFWIEGYVVRKKKG
jgi:hypothetical protein